MRAGGVAILFGAAIGVLIALARRGGEAPSDVATPRANSEHSAPSSLPAPGARALAPSASEPPAALATVAPPAAPTSEQPAETAPSASVAETSAGPPPAAAGAASAAPSPADPSLPFATPLPPVTSKSELDRAEIRCYEVDPEECGRAADAYDTGQLVPRDVARATRLRKVELTRLVRRCEERSAHACLVLAGRYEAGQGVDENDRHARALVEHARELCRRHPTAECVNGEPK
jgi:hypothetical protein